MGSLVWAGVCGELGADVATGLDWPQFQRVDATKEKPSAAEMEAGGGMMDEHANIDADLVALNIALPAVNTETVAVAVANSAVVVAEQKESEEELRVKLITELR